MVSIVFEFKEIQRIKYNIKYRVKLKIKFNIKNKGDQNTCLGIGDPIKGKYGAY